MDIPALFSKETKGKAIELVLYLKHRPELLTDVAAMLGGSGERAVALFNDWSPDAQGLVMDLMTGIKADTDSPQFMRVVMKAMMGGK